MKRSLLVLKDVNYGASTGSSTKNTALTPDMLADGALGIYGINPSTNKHVLITDASSGTGLLAAAANAVSEFVMYVGTSVAGKPIKTGSVDPNKVVVKSSHYVAPVKQVYAVGYNPSTASGSLNLPATILRGDEALIKLIDKAQVDEIVRSGDTYSGYANVDSAGEYSILKDLLDNVHADSNRKVNVEIRSNGTPTYLTSTQDATLVNGSNTITFAADPSWAVGDYVWIRSSLVDEGTAALYKIATENSATSYELDRPWQGTSGTIDVSVEVATIGKVATITEHGLEFTDANFDAAINVVTLGILSSATVALVTASVRGNGTESHLIAKEKQTWDRVDRVNRRWDLPTSNVAASGTYDQYTLSVRNQYNDKAGSGGVKTSASEIIVATPTGIADTAGKNQSDFEDILTAFGASGFATII